MKFLQLGLKYCGGCSPRYDRVEWVAAFKQKIAHWIELVPYDDPKADAVLVVIGCESACVDTAPFHNKPHFLFWRESQMEALFHWLDGIEKSSSPV